MKDTLKHAALIVLLGIACGFTGLILEMLVGISNGALFAVMTLFSLLADKRFNELNNRLKQLRRNQEPEDALKEHSEKGA